MRGSQHKNGSYHQKEASRKTREHTSRTPAERCDQAIQDPVKLAKADSKASSFRSLDVLESLGNDELRV